MTIQTVVDARKIIGFLNVPTNSNITATSSAGKLTFTVAPASGTPTVLELVISSYAGFTVPSSVTLWLDAALANGKAIYGDGTAIARGRATGEDLSSYSIFTDQIHLADGAAYTITATQAMISQFGVSGAPRDLRSANSASKITVIAPAGGSLTEIQLDRNDGLVLSASQGYTLTGEQALIAKVGATGTTSDLQGAGALLIQASQGLDLSSLRLKSSDVLELGPGRTMC